MSYLVIARKYRPASFSDVIGQDHITTTLTNAIAHSKVHHAYIFTGPRGVGKTSISRILAKALNCETGITSTPCGKCSNCIEIEQGSSIDVREIDGASNRSIDDIRELRDGIKFSPASCRKKIFIIDEVHMLTQQAFNALLKTLEEPPPHAMFIFATTEINEVPATILSRCQRFDFKRVEISTLKTAMGNICRNEGVEIDDESLTTIAKAGDGSVRDTQSVLDRVIAYCGNSITAAETSNALGLPQFTRFITLFEIALEKDSGKLFLFIEELLNEGIHTLTFLDQLLKFVRDLLLYQSTLRADLLSLSDGNIQELMKLSGKYRESDLLIFLDILSQGIQTLKGSTSARVDFELILLKIVHYESVDTLGDILKKLSNLDGDFDIPEMIAVTQEVEKRVETTTPTIKIEEENVIEDRVEETQTPKQLEVEVSNGEKVAEKEAKVEENIESISSVEVVEEKIEGKIEQKPLDIVEVREKWISASKELTSFIPFLEEMWKVAVPTKFSDNILTLGFDKMDKSFKVLISSKAEEIRERLREFFKMKNLKIEFVVENIDDSLRIFEIKREKKLTDDQLKEELIKENSVFEFLFNEPFNCKFEK